MLPNHSDNRSDGERQRHETGPEQQIFFRFRPLDYCRYVAEQIQKTQSKAERRDYITDIVRRVFCAIFTERWFLLVILLVVASLFIAWLSKQNILSANQTVALFTGLLFMAASIQFVAIGLQWRAMRQQLEYMRLEQRPWLAFGQPTIEIEEGKPVSYTLFIRNTGHSPGWLKAGGTTIIRDDTGRKLDDEVGKIHNWAKLQLHENVIPPNGTLAIPVSPPLGDMTAPALAAIHAGTIRAYVVAHITYVDWDNGTHWTTCCYRYNADLKHLTVYKNYNDMDR